MDSSCDDVIWQSCDMLYSKHMTTVISHVIIHENMINVTKSSDHLIIHENLHIFTFAYCSFSGPDSLTIQDASGNLCNVWI